MVKEKVVVLMVVFVAAQIGPVSVFAAPTAVVKNADLDFGTFLSRAGYTGSVTIDTFGARSFSGGLVLLGAVFSPGKFTITGNSGKSYTLSVPTTLTLTSGTQTMTVTGITPSISLTGVIPATGQLPFNVGGTLNVTSSQTNGTYNGTFSVTVK